MFLGRFEQAPGCLNVLDVGEDWIVRAVNVAPVDLVHCDDAQDDDGAVLGAVPGASGFAGSARRLGRSARATGYRSLVARVALQLRDGLERPVRELHDPLALDRLLIAAPVLCLLPGSRNGFASFQFRNAFISEARVGFRPALYISWVKACATETP